MKKCKVLAMERINKKPLYLTLEKENNVCELSAVPQIMQKVEAMNLIAKAKRELKAGYKFKFPYSSVYPLNFQIIEEKENKK